MAAPLAERLAFTLQLAASEIDEKIYADWLRLSCVPA
jgi:death-on-curing protein